MGDRTQEAGGDSMPSLYIMRHGPAEAGFGGADAERALSFEGMRVVTDAAAGLRAFGVRFDRVITSPLVRCVQTGAALCAVIEVAETPVQTDLLCPGAQPDAVIEGLRNSFGEHTVLIGHMPDVSYLTGFLVSGQACAAVVFSPATVACVEFAGTPRPGAGALRWVMPPEQLIRQGLVG
jgi:phosphohistidine phosphatase